MMQTLEPHQRTELMGVLQHCLFHRARALGVYFSLVCCPAVLHSLETESHSNPRYDMCGKHCDLINQSNFHDCVFTTLDEA